MRPIEKKLPAKNIKFERIGKKPRKKDKKWTKFALIYSIFFNKNNSKLISITMRDIQKSYSNWLLLENSSNAIKGWGRIERVFKTKLNKKTRKIKVFFKYYKEK